jgi:hypothetical protein
MPKLTSWMRNRIQKSAQPLSWTCGAELFQQATLLGCTFNNTSISETDVKEFHERRNEPICRRGVTSTEAFAGNRYVRGNEDEFPASLPKESKGCRRYDLSLAGKLTVSAFLSK